MCSRGLLKWACRFFILIITLSSTVASSKTIRPRGVFVLLLKDKVGLSLYALQSIEWAFNHRHGYPIVVFHEGLSLEDQARMKQTTSRANMTFVLVDIMKLPPWLKREDIPDKVPGFTKAYLGYRAMCRFFSGTIFEQEELANYDYMWRIDEDSLYICPIEYDVFAFMQERHLYYGWNLMFFEGPPVSADTLWQATYNYMSEHAIPTSKVEYLLSWTGAYSRCQYWNNFEVLDLRQFRGNVSEGGPSSQYMHYFRYLDRLNGFYNYRWGDALVRTLAANMFFEPQHIHRFDDIGYHHQNICVNPCHAVPPLQLPATLGGAPPVNASFSCLEQPPDGLCQHCNWWEIRTRGIEAGTVLLWLSAILLGILLCRWWLVSKRSKRRTNKNNQLCGDDKDVES